MFNIAGGMLRAIRMSIKQCPGNKVTVLYCGPSSGKTRLSRHRGYGIHLLGSQSNFFKEIYATEAIPAKTTFHVLCFMARFSFLAKSNALRLMKRGIRFNNFTKTWKNDQLILDERFLMYNSKGMETILAKGLLE